jgi:AraC family transcriptional regulator of adaptative response / DNA-3-methyladenine glycosylase II
MAAAAEAAGFRACLRCRPYRLAGSLPWEAPELVCRAVQLIIAGALDDGTEADLGRRLGVSARHLRRMFHEHLGLTPDQFARSRRAHFARRLLDDTDLSLADIAFAAGFGSVRQFNRRMLEVFRSAPQELRNRRRRADRLIADGGLALRLPLTDPYDWEAFCGVLESQAIQGVEAVDGGVYRRTVMLDGGPGLIEVGRGGEDHLVLRAHLPYWEGLIHIVERVRLLLGLDAAPGSTVPGAWTPFEAGVRAILRRHPGPVLLRLVHDHGLDVAGLPHGLTHAFPGPEALAVADLQTSGLPPQISDFAKAVAAGDLQLDGSADLDAVIAAMTAVPGVDQGTAHHLARMLRLPQRSLTH